MSRHVLGAVVLLVADRAARSVEVTDFASEIQIATEVPAVVAGEDGLLLELACRRWESGGQVVCLSRGDSSPAFDRLLHGVRLGLQPRDNGTDTCELGLLRWDAAGRWGNVSSASEAEMDELLGGPIRACFAENGGVDFGTREQVISDASKRRRFLMAAYPASDPVVPLVAYTLSRVLPIVRATKPAAGTS